MLAWGIFLEFAIMLREKYMVQVTGYSPMFFYVLECAKLYALQHNTVVQLIRD